MKVLIVGAGAIGGLVGALLTEKGHDVVMLARSRPLSRLRIEGGAYGPDRDVEVRSATAAPAGFAPDLVVLGTKTQDLAAAIDQHRAAFRNAPVVGLQNGLAQDEIISRALGPARTISCIVALDSTFLGDGRIACARPGTFLLSRDPSADVAARILADAVRVERIADVQGARWTKLLVNLQNVIPALTDLSYQEAAKHPQLARAIVRMMREARAVADAEKVTLAPLPWTNPLLLRALSRMPEALAVKLFARRVQMVLGKTPAYGSTWQSKERGGAWETEWLNGEVVRRGRALGVPTPVNARAVDLAAKGASLSPDECAAALLIG